MGDTTAIAWTDHTFNLAWGCTKVSPGFEDHPTIDAERAKLWPLIRETRWLDWLLLTKRADRIEANLPADWGEGYSNVWLGVSVESQKYLDLRGRILAKIPAAVRFLSVEPLLERVDLSGLFDNIALDRDTGAPFRINDFEPEIHWVIVGGESGPRYRPMDHAWASELRDQCRAAGVAFFFKQSAAPRTEMGIRLDGEIVREYPESRGTVGAGLFA